MRRTGNPPENGSKTSQEGTFENKNKGKIKFTRGKTAEELIRNTDDPSKTYFHRESAGEEDVGRRMRNLKRRILEMTPEIFRAPHIPAVRKRELLQAALDAVAEIDSLGLFGQPNRPVYEAHTVDTRRDPTPGIPEHGIYNETPTDDGGAPCPMGHDVGSGGGDNNGDSRR